MYAAEVPDSNYTGKDPLFSPAGIPSVEIGLKSEKSKQ